MHRVKVYPPNTTKLDYEKVICVRQRFFAVYFSKTSVTVQRENEPHEKHI